MVKWWKELVSLHWQLWTNFEAVVADVRCHKSGAEFFGFTRAHIQQELNAALNQDPQEPAHYVLLKNGPVSQGNLSGLGKKKQPNFMEGPA